MFGSKPDISIILDNAENPLWTTGSIASGNIQLLITSKISVIDIKVSIQCEEIACVAQKSSERVLHFAKTKDVRRATKSTSKKETHYKISQDVLAFDPSIGPHVLEAGEYLFPFTMELSSEINQCPPSALVVGENGITSGVQWSLKAVARRSHKLIKNSKTELELIVFPRENSKYAPAYTSNLNSDKELSGRKYITQKLSLWDKVNNRSKLTGASLEATLKYPAKGIPQRPLHPRLSLLIKANEAPVQLNSAKIELLRRCEVTVKGARDEYTTRHLIGGVTVSRKVQGEVDLTEQVTGLSLPSLFAPAFSTALIRIHYDLALTVNFLPIINSNLQNEDSVYVETPVELQNIPFEKLSKTVTFMDQQVSLKDVIKARRPQTATSVTESRTTGVSTATSGTWADVDIEGPTEFISSWLNNITGGH